MKNRTLIGNLLAYLPMIFLALVVGYCEITGEKTPSWVVMPGVPAAALCWAAGFCYRERIGL